MKLPEKMELIKKEAVSKASKSTLEIINRATAKLKRPESLNKALKVGDTAPEFTLPDTTGKIIRLSNCLRKGPVVLSFYRGQW